MPIPDVKINDQTLEEMTKQELNMIDNVLNNFMTT